MHVLDDKAQRDLIVARSAIRNAAAISGRGIITLLALLAWLVAGFTSWQWSRALDYARDLEIKLLAASQSPQDRGLSAKSISGDTVESALMQWSEWRYSKAAATLNADYGKVFYFLSPDLATAFGGADAGQYNAGKVMAEHEACRAHGTCPDEYARADAIELIERLTDSRERVTAYRYQVLLTVTAGEREPPHYRRVTLTIRLLNKAEQAQRFKDWESRAKGAGLEFQKFNGNGIEIFRVDEAEDLARSMAASRNP